MDCDHRKLNAFSLHKFVTEINIQYLIQFCGRPAIKKKQKQKTKTEVEFYIKKNKQIICCLKETKMGEYNQR